MPLYKTNINLRLDGHLLLVLFSLGQFSHWSKSRMNHVKKSTEIREGSDKYDNTSVKLLALRKILAKKCVHYVDYLLGHRKRKCRQWNSIIIDGQRWKMRNLKRIAKHNLI